MLRSGGRHSEKTRISTKKLVNLFVCFLKKTKSGKFLETCVKIRDDTYYEDWNQMISAMGGANARVTVRPSDTLAADIANPNGGRPDGEVLALVERRRGRSHNRGRERQIPLLENVDFGPGGLNINNQDAGGFG